MNIDWEHIAHTLLDRYKFQLSLTPQPIKWHGEGDVLTHTMMVLDALQAMPEYGSLPQQQQHVLHIAALLHDIGKIATTRVEMGELISPSHAPIGSRMARELLWKGFGLCGTDEAMRIREAICMLIRYHSLPPHAIDADDVRLRLHRVASNGLLVPEFSLKLLCMLARADMLGRKCCDKQQMLDQISLCEELAKEEDCYESCYDFPFPDTRRAFLSGADIWKDQQLYDRTWGEVVLMCGLPGTGKDTWIDKNLSDIPMISLDEIRRIHKVSPKADQGFVANLAREQAKVYLRSHQPFVWNATNLTRQTRESLVNLFETYRASVRIVYLETDWRTQLQRNAGRPDAVPCKVIDDMLKKLNPPEAFEAEKIIWKSL